ncbi:hypothetical protein H9P43_001724 [Blastocladiella emersonii ATCC 22665]|nr:hypothetical protein H9P43_001724 [Blastocladiella emersonii ATCC 22665]
MEHFPHLTQTNETTFAGLVLTQGHDIPLVIRLPTGWRAGAPLTATEIYTEAGADGEKLVAPALAILSSRLPVLCHLNDFFLELHHALTEHVSRAPETAVQGQHSAALAELAEDLDSVADLLGTVDSSLTRFTLRITVSKESHSRVAVVHVRVSPQYPAVAPEFISHEVSSKAALAALTGQDGMDAAKPAPEPTLLQVRWNRAERFAGVVPQLSTLLCDYLEYWSELETLAKSARLRALDAAAAAAPLAHPWRTLDLGSYTYLELAVDPASPRARPRHARFTGTQALVAKYMEVWRTTSQTGWDVAQPISENVARVLDIALPSPAEHGVAAAEVACAICFEGEEEEPLGVQCTCGEQFHTDCLLSTLRRAGSTTVFNHVHGTCPVCSTIVGLVLHPIAVCLLGYSLVTSLRNARSSKSVVFWAASGLTNALLIVTCLLEITYVSTFLDDQRNIKWTPLQTMIGDITVRCGIAGMTALRLYRLRLIAPGKFKKPIVSVIFGTVIMLIASLAVTVMTRTMELDNYGTPTTAATTASRKTESITTFAIFMVVQLINLGADYCFYLVLVKSAESSNGESTRLSAHVSLSREIGLPYLPSFIVDLAYMAAMIASQKLVDDRDAWSVAMFLTITLCRFAPAVELFVFFQFTVPQTRVILRARAPTGRSTGSGPANSTGGGGNSASQSRNSLTLSRVSLGPDGGEATQPSSVMGTFNRTIGRWFGTLASSDKGGTASRPGTSARVASESTAAMIPMTGAGGAGVGAGASNKRPSKM